LSNELSDVNGHVNALIISSLAIYNIALMFALGIAMYQIKHQKSFEDRKRYIIFISFLILVIPIIPIAISAGIKNSKFSEYLDSIKSEDSQFIVNIKNDKKYFYNNKDGENKAEFDKLTLDEKRKLKTYYSTYKNKETVEDKKTQSQKDYEQLLGFNENKDNLYSYLDDFTT
jgi:glucan phosphoethanolaminetransferase (alkaline phosphatase superfamily)